MRATRTFTNEDKSACEDSFCPIKHGTLRMRLGIFHSAGSWEMGYRIFNFRWQSEHVALIGYGRTTIRRNNGAKDNVNYNFLTRRVKHVSGNIAGRDKPTVERKKLPNKPLLTLEQVGNGLDFNPERKGQP